MSEPIRAYPLQWPAGWRRTPAVARTRADRGGDAHEMARINAAREKGLSLRG